MSDTVYRVVTVYDADTRAAEQSVGGLAIVFDHLINLMDRARGMMAHVLELGSAAEGARISIAGLMNASGAYGAGNFQHALMQSDAIIQKMKADAAALPGEFEELQAVFQFAIPGGIKAGRSVAEIEDMSGKLMAVGKTFGIGAEIAGREFGEMMEGRVRGMTPLFAKLKQFMGEDMTAGQFNALSAQDKFAMLEKAITHFNPMIEEYGKTWDAISSTTAQYAKELARVGSGGLFEGLKAELGNVNTWFEQNQEKILQWAREVGQKMGHALIEAFKTMRETFAFLAAHKDAIIKIGEVLLLAKGASMLGGGWSKGALGSGGGASLGNVAGGALFGEAVAQLTGAGDAMTRTMMAAEGALASLPGTVGLVGKALLGLHGVLQTFADKMDSEHKKAVEAEGDYLGVIDEIKRGQGGAFYSYAKSQGMVKDGELHVGAFNAWLQMQDRVAHSGASTLSDWDAARLTGRAAELVHSLTDKATRGKVDTYGPMSTPEQRAAAELYTRGRATAAKHDTNVYVHVEQTLHDAAEPDRVYVATSKAIRDAMTHRSSSAHGLVVR